MCPDFRGGAKKQPVPWPGGPGYNGAFVYIPMQFYVGSFIKEPLLPTWHSSYSNAILY